MVEWIVVCAALTVLDDEIIIAAERAGLPVAAGPVGRQPASQVRQMQPHPSMRGPPGQPRGPPQPQRSLPPQRLVHGQPSPSQARGPPPGGEGYYQNGGRPHPRGDPRMVDPRYAQQQEQQQQLASRGDPRAGQLPPGASRPRQAHRPPHSAAYAELAAQPVLHQLRDEPARGPPPPGAQPSGSQPRGFAPPSQHPSLEESRADLPALDRLALDDPDRPSELAYGAAEPSALRAQVVNGAQEYVQMAAASGTGYQPEPVAVALGYQAQPQSQGQARAQPQPQSSRYDDPRMRSAPLPNNGHPDPRVAERGPPVRGLSQDAYGAAPPGQRHPNGYGPPQAIPHAQPPPPAQPPQPQPQSQPRGPPPAAARSSSPSPPDPSTPEFLTWVASREEHKWPEEAGQAVPPGQAPSAAPAIGAGNGRMPSSYRAGPPRQGYQGGGLGEGAYRGPAGGAQGPSGLSRLDTSVGQGGPAGRGSPSSPSGKGKLVKQRAR